jgi:predicted ArsR family transcriptional regulator
MPDDDAARTVDRLLLLLKTRGPLSTRALAEALEISVPAVRQQLASLGDQVTSASVNRGVGRPARLWRLTPAARSRFPDTHAQMTVRLIDLVEAGLGTTALERVLNLHTERSLVDYRERLSGSRTLGARLRRLARIRSDEGYMAEVRRDGDAWLLIEHHCPICAAAERCQGFCRSELVLFRAVLGDGVVVTRAEYLLDGGERCAYRITAARAGGRSRGSGQT